MDVFKVILLIGVLLQAVNPMPQGTETGARETCVAPLVWEGQTGKLTYFFRPEVLSSQDLYITLKRADNPGKSIITCIRRSRVECSTSNVQYSVDSITNHSLTVLIPDVKTDFEDTYLLLSKAKGTFQRTEICHLVVKAREATCVSPEAVPGQTAKLTFYIRPDILAFEDFFATLRRSSNPGKDVMVCTRRSPVQCHTTSSLYQSTGIIDDSLTLLIPNVTHTFSDTYVLKIYANGSSYPFVACSPDIKDISGHTKCEISSATEGGPAIIKFTLKSDIDMTDNKFYAHIRRGKDGMKNIITCHTPTLVSEKGCDIRSGFQVESDVTAKTLTVRISNMSRDLEDTYVLQINSSGQAVTTSNCTLSMTAVATDADPETESGNKSWIAAVIILLLVITAVVLVYFRKKLPPQVQALLERVSSYVQGLWRRLTRNREESPDSQGNDQPRANDSHDYVANPRNPEKQPFLHEMRTGESLGDQGSNRPGVGGTPSDFTPQHNQDSQPLLHKSVVATGIPLPPPPQALEEVSMPALTSDATAMGEPVVEKRETAAPANVLPPQEKTSQSAQKFPDDKKGKKSHAEKRWFAGNLSQEEVDKLMRFRKNGTGSFLITQDKNSPGSFTLHVLCSDGKVQRFPVTETGGKFEIYGTKKTFKTLCELVEHYRDKKIGDSRVKLNRPCGVEPNEAWYFGKLTQQEADELFSSEDLEEGSFAVYDGITDPENYTLSVIFIDKNKSDEKHSVKEKCSVAIKPVDDGFKTSHGKKTFEQGYFKTLPALVDHYKRHILTCSGRFEGRLTKPCDKLLTTEEKQLLKKHGPGSFFIKPFAVADQHVLAVNTNMDGKIKTFTIISDANGRCRLGGIGLCHRNIPELVNHYRRNGLDIDHEESVRLLTDCTKELEEIQSPKPSE